LTVETFLFHFLARFYSKVVREQYFKIHSNLLGNAEHGLLSSINYYYCVSDKFRRWINSGWRGLNCLDSSVGASNRL